MDYNSIMQSIITGMSGDAEKDIEYLNMQMEKYKNHENGKEILRACGRMIYNLIPEEKRKEIEKLMEEQGDVVENSINEIHIALQNNDVDKAVQLVTELAKQADELHMYENDSVSEYYTFFSPMEETLYRVLNDPQKDVRQAQHPYARIYLEQGSVFFEAQMYDEAEKALEKALRWNPVNTQIACEYLQTIKVRKDWKVFLKCITKQFKYAYTKSAIASLYRNLGYYFFEVEEYANAKMCYVISLQFEENNMNALMELKYIDEVTGGNIDLPSEEEAKNIAFQYGFPLGANDDVIGIAYSLGKKYLESGELGGAKYYLSIAYELTEAEEIKKMLDIIG